MFKRNQKSAAQLQEQLKELSGSQKFEKDPTEWTMTVDKAGNGSAVIRFLPATGEGEEVIPFVKMFSHSFKEPKTNKWYIENCPTTIGKPYDDCPVCSGNSALFEAGKTDKAIKDYASSRSRKLSYWANIVVIKDEANPEAVGGTFKYRFGKKIFEKIEAALNPDLEEESPILVTDVYEGANFHLKAKKVSGFQNYDDSKFVSQTSELFGGDEEKLNKAWAAMHPLKPIVAEKQFKSKAELDKSYARATGGTAARKETTGEREVREAREETPTKVYENPKNAVVEDDSLPFDTDAKAGNGSARDDIDDIQSFLDGLDS
jgi:hypothetical protein